MVFIAREIIKLCMFTVIWGFPVLLTIVKDNNYFLLLFVVSSVLNIWMFSHYERLESIDSFRKCCKTKKDE